MVRKYKNLWIQTCPKTRTIWVVTKNEKEYKAVIGVKCKLK